MANGEVIMRYRYRWAKCGSTALSIFAFLGPACRSANTLEATQSLNSVQLNLFADPGQPLEFITAEQKALFDRGRALATHRFSKAEGLGPHFNVTFCGACHEKPTLGGNASRYRQFLLVGETLDGVYKSTGVNGIQNQYNVESPVRHPNDPRTNTTALRVPIAFFGAGLIAAIDSSEISKRSDPDDKNGDGISGSINIDPLSAIGRFGRKAQNSSVEQFIRGPLFNHLGITTNPLTPETVSALHLRPPQLTHASTAMTLFEKFLDEAGSLTRLSNAKAQGFIPVAKPTTDEDGVADPEMNEESLASLVALSMFMAAPRPDPLDDTSTHGKKIFENAKCTSCHVPSMHSPLGDVPLFSDLLIHDMGQGLSDNTPFGLATGSEFRTQPLWGVAAAAPYLHDGRADTLDEAIRAHGGEAENSKNEYINLSELDRAALIAFLESLGGRSQKSQGMLPPNDPTPSTGTLGGPATPLTDEAMQQYNRGRILFDTDFALSRGLGPNFNGDACRSCHFDPVLGGAGPMDVDVIRYGFLTASNLFAYPSGGTMAHKHAVGALRPPLDQAATIFEARQTPHVFGLGRIDRVADATIIALAAEPKPYGIGGRAHILSNGKVGKFGWKANVPSVIEFVRDAMSNEMGITVPGLSGQTFGFSADDDAIADPELSAKELEDLVFFLTQLAPPARSQTNNPEEIEGEALFASTGCAVCHVPSLNDADNQPVPLFSDLLLHDVAPTGFFGIEDGDVGMREFRTPPLWGVSKTAPYMHNGRAPTLLDAIAAHAGEATAVRQRFVTLSSDERAKLIKFINSL